MEARLGLESLTETLDISARDWEFPQIDVERALVITPSRSQVERLDRLYEAP
jgi:hypothetical protein